MCGFKVYTSDDIDKKDFECDFDKIKYRGPDQANILVNGGIFGFHRLAIMDLTEHGMQPFTMGDDKLVCNGEIFNHEIFVSEILESGYKFHSSSDCEVLLPLYRKYGVEMFKMLDAEFALVLYDAKLGEFIAGRDPIGVRPMFYGYSKISGKIMFASEAKALLTNCNDIMPFPPGHYYFKGEFVCFNDPSIASDYHDDELPMITKKINQLLTNAIIKRLDSDAPLGFLLSGGLDSSLVCSIAAKHLNKPIKTFAIGMDTDAIDLKYAKEVADFIKSDHTEVIIKKEDVLNSLSDVIYHLETWDITTIRASVGMYLLCKWIQNNTDIKVLLTGEVSDELFGYKYTDYAPTKEAFQCESEKRIKELYMYDGLRADRCIAAASLEARVPFADLAFVDYVMGINPAKKMNTYGQGKYLLRQAFTNNYLPDSILNREKAAFSDAVGHSLVDYLKEYAESCYTDEEFKLACAKYSYNPPYTKESLLYRDLFEKHFPNQAKWIKGYWLPNQTWDGCQVNDPSARYLDNYGDSGK